MPQGRLPGPAIPGDRYAIGPGRTDTAALPGLAPPAGRAGCRGRVVSAARRAALYVRVSTSGQELDGSSLETQEMACGAYAGAHGASVVEVYREVYSGTELWDRPRLSALREAVRRHEFDVVIAYAIDRLSRDPVHLGVILSEADHHQVAV